MKRPWVVLPDEGEVEVSDDAILASMMEASAILKRSGGVLTVLVDRRATGRFPGEMFTAAAIFEWKDRTDARQQPESTQSVLPVLDPDPEPDELEERLAAEERYVDPALDPDAEALEHLEDEDVSSIPTAAR